MYICCYIYVLIIISYLLCRPGYFLDNNLYVIMVKYQYLLFSGIVMDAENQIMVENLPIITPNGDIVVPSLSFTVR